MAVTPNSKTQVYDGKYEKFKPSPDQQVFLDTYGKKDGRDCARLKQAIKMAFSREMSWRKCFFEILNAESGS